MAGVISTPLHEFSICWSNKLAYRSAHQNGYQLVTVEVLRKITAERGIRDLRGRRVEDDVDQDNEVDHLDKPIAI